MNSVIDLAARSVSRTCLVRVSRNRMAFRHIESGRELSLDPDRPFTDLRMLIAGFSAAQHVLRQGVLKCAGRFGLAPVIVLYPSEMTEGGLSESEERLLLDLGYGVGAQFVAVVMNELSDSEVHGIVRQRRSFCA